MSILCHELSYVVYMHIRVYKNKAPACGLVGDIGNKPINKCLGTKHRGRQEELIINQRP